MLKINDKTFMNLQEAVQWLLDNNALPFQSSANYVANTEIGMGTIVNPSPAKVRIGSLIFFADSKVSTVIGLTEKGFICSDQYNDLVDDVVYVSNVALNASGHLIVTLSNGNTIDAGLVKQVSSFVINASQHLVVSYNDGSTADLGAIFTGNVNIAGNFTADSIIENMSGYSYTAPTPSDPDITITKKYAGVVKNGNKITIVVAGEISSVANKSAISVYTGRFYIPTAIGQKLFPMLSSEVLDMKQTALFLNDYTYTPILSVVYKRNNATLEGLISLSSLTANITYAFRQEVTFLLSDSL